MYIRGVLVTPHHKYAQFAVQNGISAQAHEQVTTLISCLPAAKVITLMGLSDQRPVSITAYWSTNQTKRVTSNRFSLIHMVHLEHMNQTKHDQLLVGSFVGMFLCYNR